MTTSELERFNHKQDGYPFRSQESGGPPGTHLCAEGDLDDCQQQCRAGSLNSCDRLGSMYLLGLCTAPDNQKAFALYSDTCAKKNPAGCLGLGVLYHRGAGVVRDEKKAFELYTQACAAGETLACKNQADLVLRDDPQKAFRLYTQACDASEVAACTRLVQAYASGRGTAQDYSKAYALAKTWCDKNSGYACGELAALVHRGKGVVANQDEAKRLGLRACALHDDDSCLIWTPAMHAALASLPRSTRIVVAADRESFSALPGAPKVSDIETRLAPLADRCSLPAFKITDLVLAIDDLTTVVFLAFSSPDLGKLLDCLRTNHAQDVEVQTSATRLEMRKGEDRIYFGLRPGTLALVADHIDQPDMLDWMTGGDNAFRSTPLGQLFEDAPRDAPFVGVKVDDCAYTAKLRGTEIVQDKDSRRCPASSQKTVKTSASISGAEVVMGLGAILGILAPSLQTDRLPRH